MTSAWSLHAKLAMITEGIARALRRYIHVAAILGASPFIWSSKTKSFKWQKSRVYLLFWLVSILYTCAEMLTTSFVITDPETKLIRRVIAFMFALAGFVTVFFFTIYTQNLTDLSGLLQRYLFFNQNQGQVLFSVSFFSANKYLDIQFCCLNFSGQLQAWNTNEVHFVREDCQFMHIHAGSSATSSVNLVPSKAT